MTPEDQLERISQLVRSMINSDHKKGTLNWSKIAGMQAAKEVINEALIMPYLGKVTHQAAWKRKSLFAKATAGEVEKQTGVNYTYYEVHIASLVSTWAGETEKVLRDVFLSAFENTPAIIFFDEIDCLTGKRKDADGPGSLNTKSQFLSVLSSAVEHNVFVIGTTNRPNALDDGFVRRFQKKIYVGLPNVLERVEILSVIMQHFPDWVCWHNIDFDKLAKMTNGCSGDDLGMWVKLANYASAKDKNIVECDKNVRCITMSHFKASKGKYPRSGNSADLSDFEDFAREYCKDDVNDFSGDQVQRWPFGVYKGFCGFIQLLLCGWIDLCIKPS